MRRFFLTILSIVALTVPALADDNLPTSSQITVAQAMSMAAALRNLDGRMVVVKQQNGADATIMTPWEFGSGTLRMKLARDTTILDDVGKAVETARQNIVKEVLKKFEVTEIKPGTPEFDDFQKQYTDLLASRADGSEKLSRIKASELKLDKNELPVTVLSALAPILDDDSGSK